MTVTISRTDAFFPVALEDMFPSVGLGAVITDDQLAANSFGRVLAQSDYSFDPMTQRLVPVEPAFDDQAGVWNTYGVVQLGDAEVLTVAKVTKITALAQTYQGIVASGFMFGGVSYQIDTASAQLMLTVKVQIKDGIRGLGYWAGTDNMLHPMDDQTALTFFDAAYSYGEAVKDNFFKKRVTIMLAPDLQSVAAVDPKADWPPNK